MTLKELYSEIEGNYEEIMGRMNDEGIVGMLVGMLLEDASYAKLVKAMDEENVEEAFGAAHTLKGICANISVTKLEQISSEITELLRGGLDFEGAKAKMDDLSQIYRKTIDKIKEFMN